MILSIGDVLTAAELAELRSLLAGGRWQTGDRTAGWHARGQKRNRQLAGGNPATRRAQTIVETALRRSEVFAAAALPRTVRPALLARYGAGEEYGLHVDNALMGAAAPGGPTRADIAVTVFLADPSGYGGGELEIDGPAGSQQIKLPAGAAVVYPATTLHRVAPVTAGERDVAVTWVQSLVRSAERREILFDLDRARRAVFDREGKTDLFDLLAKSYSNLLRQWAEP